jgi:hypothetical protein
VRKSIGIRNVNKKKRIAWSRGKLHWTVNNQWRKVVYSDEMMIVIKPDQRFRSLEIVDLLIFNIFATSDAR